MVIIITTGDLLVKVTTILPLFMYRVMNGNIHENDEETDSSEEEDSDDDRSGNSDYETECYESYTSKTKEPIISQKILLKYRIYQ